MTWRLIQFDYFDAATNMAIDEAILEAHLMGSVPPTLRLYGFKPGAVSVGYAQKLSEAFVNRVQQNGFDLVRRPTGGRAVLHVDDLTYSFVGSTIRLDRPIPTVVPQQEVVLKCTAGAAPVQETVEPFSEGDASGFLSQSVLEAYKQICLGLINGFRCLGINLEIGRADRSYKNIDDCFAATTGADLHYDGKKMIGSAQLRRKHTVLQHGSVLLKQDQVLMQELLGIRQTSKATDIRHANLFDILGHDIAIAQLEEAITLGFCTAFGREFKKSLLTQMELDLTGKLRAKYLEIA